MVKTISLFSLWLGFLGYAIFLAPPDQPDTLDLIQRLIKGPFTGINPLIIALFNLMGVWPMIYTAVLLGDGRGQKLPAWLFAIGGFLLGAFALIPYLALRHPNPTFKGPLDWGLRAWEWRGTGVLLLFVTLGLVGYGISQGDWADFGHQWQTSRFIHLMSLDFCLLTLLFPLLLGDDMARRQDDRPSLKFLGWVPLFGPLLYLCLRSKLVDADKVYPKIQSADPQSV